MILCKIGIHKWEEKRVVEWRREYTTMSLDGDVCAKCGKHRYDPLKMDAVRMIPQKPVILQY